jgi:hypothetical protein
LKYFVTFWSPSGEPALDECVLLLLSEGYENFIAIFIGARFGVSHLKNDIDFLREGKNYDIPHMRSK